MTSTSVVLPEVTNFLPNVNGPVTGRLSGYLKVEDLTHITLIVDGANVGARVNVDGSLVIDSFLVQPLMNNTIEISLSDDRLHFVILEFFSLSNVTQRNIRLLWKKEQQLIHHGLTGYGTSEVITDFYYSVNTCGDRIIDPMEANTSSRFFCPKETSKVALGSSLSTCSAGVCLPTSQCGNGVCMELFVDDCFTDCYSYVTKTCNAVAVKPGLITDMPATDTLGDLIKNQMLMHLPGIEHMASGVNIINGEESQSPLFYQSYCNPEDIATIQDSYRGMVYTVPDGLYAIPSPKCVFSASSTVYESSIEMANSYTKSSAYDVDISGNLKVDTIIWGKYSLSAAYSSSGEKSVNTARSLRTKRSGSIVVSDIVCETSKVQQSTMSLHPIFLEDLASVNNISDIIPLMRKYGTHFYKSATMGGRLRQVTVLDKQYQAAKSSRDIEESSKMSISASVGGSAYGATVSVSGSYASSKDSSVSVEQQSEYESSSSRSTIITYGGPPGSFGPTTSNAPSNFGDWASAVDLLPVPIDYQLLPIYTAINAKWVTKKGESIRQLWYNAQTEFRDSFSETTEVHPGSKFSLHWYTSNGVAPWPLDDVQYTLVFDGASYPLWDNSGPPGTYAPITGSVRRPDTYPNPISIEFYHPNATWGTAVPYLTSSGTNAINAWGSDATFIIFHNWNTSELVCFGGFSSSPGILPPIWYKEQISSWNTRLRIQFELQSDNGITLPSGNGTGHSMEFSLKGDTPNKSFSYVVDFTNSFPAAGKRKTYFIDIPISTTSTNRITVIKKIGLQYGTRGVRVTTPSTFLISKMWAAVNLDVQNSQVMTVFSMGNGQLELSNLDKQPQWTEMSLLSALLN